jgi:hypothetical protein
MTVAAAATCYWVVLETEHGQALLDPNVVREFSGPRSIAPLPSNTTTHAHTNAHAMGTIAGAVYADGQVIPVFTLGEAREALLVCQLEEECLAITGFTSYALERLDEAVLETTPKLNLHAMIEGVQKHAWRTQALSMHLSGKDLPNE